MVNKLIHYFNLAFGCTLVIVLALSMGRLFFGNPSEVGHYETAKTSSARVPSQANEMHTDAEGTTILGDVGLSSEQMAMVAKHIYHVGMSMSEEFTVADGLSLATYVLRYMAEIGEYELAQKDILILVDAFEKLGNMEVGPQVEDILNQIKKIRFGRREGKLFAQIFAINAERGVVIPINERSNDSDSSIEEIIEAVLENGSTFSFQDITKTEQIRAAKNFIREPVKLLGGLQNLVKELNQIHPEIEKNVDSFFMRDDLPAPALAIEMSKVYVRVDTSTIFDEIQFNFHTAYALPTLKNKEDNRISSFVLGAKAKLLNLKVSIDQ